MGKDSKKKNILYIVPQMNAGGVEQNVVEVSNFLVKEGFNVFLLTSSLALKRSLKKNVNVIISDVKTKNPFKIVRNVFKIAKIIKDNNINVVHVKSRAPAISVFLLKKLAIVDVEFVTTVHGLYGCDTYLKYLYGISMMKSDKVLAVSPASRNYVLNNYNINPEKIKTINRGIDLSQYSHLNISVANLSSVATYTNLDEDERKMFLFPSRISRGKGHFVLLKALSLVQRDDYCCVLMTSGVKPEIKREIIDKIIEYNLSDKVTLVENIKDIKSAYFLSYFVISLSVKEESFGRIPLESASMFRPVIASNIGNYRNTVIHNKTGFLVEPFNHFDIADKINQALNLTNEEWIAFCKNGHDYVLENYQIDDMFSRLKKVYREEN